MKKAVLAMFVVLIALSLEQLFMALKVRDLQFGCTPVMVQDLGATDLKRGDK